MDFAQIHVVAMFGKHQGDARAHDAGAQHGDAAGAGSEGLTAQEGGGRRGDRGERCHRRFRGSRSYWPARRAMMVFSLA